MSYQVGKQPLREQLEGKKPRKETTSLREKLGKGTKEHVPESEKPSVQERAGITQIYREFLSENSDLVVEIKEFQDLIEMYDEQPSLKKEINESLDYIAEQVYQRETEPGKRQVIMRHVAEKAAVAWNLDETLAKSISEKYILTDKIGGGAEGEVYSACPVIYPVEEKKNKDGSVTYEAAEKDVVKIVKTEVTDDEIPESVKNAESGDETSGESSDPVSLVKQREEALEPVLSEMRHIAQINHPNVVKVFNGDAVMYEKNLGTHELAGWYGAKKVEGDDLAKRMEDPTLTIEEGMDIASQMAAGLRATHEEGIVHGDIKPQNILIEGEEEPHAMIGDFGAAIYGNPLMDQEVEVKDTTGTPLYASPEHYSGSVNFRSDVFSMGSVLYRIFTGRDAFRESDEEDKFTIIYRIQNDQPPSLAEYRPDLPKLSELVSEMLDKEPPKRPKSEEVYIRLRNTLDEVKTSVVRNKLLKAFEQQSLTVENEQDAENVAEQTPNQAQPGIEETQNLGMEVPTAEDEQRQEQPKSWWGKIKSLFTRKPSSQDTAQTAEQEEPSDRFGFEGNLEGYLQNAAQEGARYITKDSLRYVFRDEKEIDSALERLQRKNIVEKQSSTDGYALTARARKDPESIQTLLSEE